MPRIHPFVSAAGNGAVYVYRRSFSLAERVVRCTGVVCAVETLPYGPHERGGVFPHEHTFARVRGVDAASVQTPILALHAGDAAEVGALLSAVAESCGPERRWQTAGGVVHEVWPVLDEARVQQCCELLSGRDLLIADGHHRYAAALDSSTADDDRGNPGWRSGGCAMVLVAMSDPGVIVSSFHRVVAGIDGYSWNRFTGAAAGLLGMRAAADDADGLERAVAESEDQRVLGIYDFGSERGYLARPVDPDPLADAFATRSPLWRGVGVVHAQHLVIERICQGALNAGRPVEWFCCKSAAELTSLRSRGAREAQLAILPKPPAVEAIWALSRSGELLPQKATRFHPQVASETLPAELAGIRSGSAGARCLPA